MFFRIAKEDSTLACPMTSTEESNNTMPAPQNGQRDAALGQLSGEAASYRFQKRENWKIA